MTDVMIQMIPYSGWEHCVHISNGIVDLIVTTDVGPRIIRYGFLEQANEMCQVAAMQGKTGGDEWRIYGGHRLWHSPEAKPRSYEPDNSPVVWETIPNGIRTIQKIEPKALMKKEMEITLAPDSTKVKILHRITNTGLWPVTLSAWALSVMAPGGKEVVPQSQRDTGLLGNRVLALWPYTNMQDHRVYWGRKFIALQQDPNMEPPFKFGFTNEDGWAAYFNHNHLFVKYYTHQIEASYPDYGVSYETYTTDFMLEMESLSPLTHIQPDGKVEHLEKWELFDDISMPANCDEEIEAALAGRVKK